MTVPEGERALDLLTLAVKAGPCAELQAEGIALDEKELAQCGPDTYEFVMTGLATRGAPPCYGYRITLDGDARLSEMELNDRTRQVTSVIDGQLCRSGADSLLLEPVHISGRARKPLVISRGYTTVLAAPSVMYGGATNADETHISWQLGRMPLDSVVESGTEYGRDRSDPLRLAWYQPSPETVPEPTTRLEWRADPDEPAGDSDRGDISPGRTPGSSPSPASRPPNRLCSGPGSWRAPPCRRSRGRGNCCWKTGDQGDEAGHGFCPLDGCRRQSNGLSLGVWLRWERGLRELTGLAPCPAADDPEECLNSVTTACTTRTPRLARAGLRGG
ncbi:hypothetical protein ACIHFD_32860 [Nonomuraea sp. NPDC051941]|uniref:hypothetical protein n=1 Tax=Nonomuraea sp. NPDC051941 TaxID=3364373 RepID=UPI0037CBADBE